MSGVNRAALLVLLGSAALLSGALAFQYGGGLLPCALCIWQRWAHGAAIGGGLIGATTRRPVATLGLVIGILGLLSGVGIAIFHVGVEQAWWQGLASCGGGGSTAATVDELLAQVEAAPVIRCDDIAWSLLGISMAGWNAIASLAIAVVAVVVARRH